VKTGKGKESDVMFAGIYSPHISPTPSPLRFLLHNDH
jgi:hypothetical protein